VSEGLPVLLVEDDTFLLRTLGDIVGRRGYRPLTASSGRQALDVAAEARPAIALVDLRLPDMDGMEVIGGLHRISALTEAIVLTGNASVDSAIRAMREHTCDYLVKPVAPEQLLSTLERAGERWQRRNAEEALRRSEERSQRLLQNISDVVAVVDEDLVYRYVSPSVTRVSGHRPEELIGRSCLELSHPDDTAAIERFVRDSLWSSAPQPTAAIRMRHVDGTWRLLEVTSARLVGEEDFEGLVLTARDVTERQRLEEQLRHAQKMESVGRLAGGVAHDFNNLLTAILGFSELLMTDTRPASRRNADLQAIHRAAEQGASLTRQLLAYSRRQILAPTLVDLGALTREVERILARLLGTDIEIAITGDVDPGLVKADRGQLEQVLMNLGVNARDAMPEGGRLTIDTRRVDLDGTSVEARLHRARGPYVRLTVADTGAGMDAETRARVFEPFFTTKPHGKGTGLGLATVHGIVEQSGGFVDVASEPGQGTTFTIHLPRVERQAAVPSPAAPPVQAEPATGSGTILLVEDDGALRELLSRTLGEAGYRVIAPASPEDALRLVRDGAAHPDLLVTDVVMPGMSGPALARELLAIRSGLRVLLISGYTDDAMLRIGAFDAVDALLLKPFGPASFLRKVRAIFDAPPQGTGPADVRH
jgi:PAS domain S-box-containing protein